MNDTPVLRTAIVERVRFRFSFWRQLSLKSSFSSHFMNSFQSSLDAQSFQFEKLRKVGCRIFWRYLPIPVPNGQVRANFQSEKARRNLALLFISIFTCWFSSHIRKHAIPASFRHTTWNGPRLTSESGQIWKVLPFRQRLRFKNARNLET